MEQLKLCESDYRFMTVVWDNEPVQSGQLVTLCAEKLGWKKSTTYTEIKKLGKRGFLVNENHTVVSKIKREEVQAYESEQVVDRAFSGSLPSFIAAFTKGRNISEEDAAEIMKLIDESSKKSND